MNKFSAISFNSSNDVKQWFKNELYPKMLECEKNVKQIMIEKNSYSHKRKLKSDKYFNVDKTSPFFSDQDDYIDNEEAEKLKLFLQKSSAHQRRLKEIRRQRQENESHYVLDTHGPILRDPPSMIAPSVQPQKSRFECLQSLYGIQADMIVSLETNLQARFDQTVDSMLPAYWPVIPFKFS